MRIHVVGDSAAQLSVVHAMLEQKFAVTSELLGSAEVRDPEADAVIVTADLRLVENIAALKRTAGKLSQIRRRVFFIDRRTRLSVVQAYALGATHVLTNPVSKAQLLAKLFDHRAAHVVRSG